MGFLDNLLKKGVKNIINNLVDETTDRISDVIEDTIGGKADESKTVNSSSNANTKVNTTADIPESVLREMEETAKQFDSYKDKFDNYDFGICATTTTMPVMTRISNILRTEYPEYEVKNNILPYTIGGKGMFRPYTYGLYLNGEPKAFIMVTDHNKEVRRAFRWSKEEAEKNGIPFINFLTQFPNTEEYIKNRLAQYIK